MSYTKPKETSELTDVKNTIKALRGEGVDFIQIAQRMNRSYTLVKSVMQGRARNRFIYDEVLKIVQSIELTPNQQLIKKMLDMRLSNKELARRLHVRPSRISEAIHEYPSHNAELRKMIIQLVEDEYMQRRL